MNEIMSLILEKQKNIILEMRISSLLESNLSNSDIHNTLKSINYSFFKYVTAIYCYSENINDIWNKNLIDLLSKNKATTCLPFKNGLLLLITYNSISKSELNKMLDFYINHIKYNINDSIIGISDNYIPITSCKNAINQALISSSSYSISNEKIIKYNSLGIYSLLMCCKDLDEAKELYSNIMKPILDYDKANKSFLLETLISFVNHDGDYKKVSSELFQHENTIRYRILKVKSILNLDKSNIEFYEKISIGVKLHRIYNI
ncbi:PucR family transcriptional regulator [Paraclostridium bifermentans]